MMERRKNLNDKFGFVEIMEYTSIGESCSVVSGGTPSRSKNEYWENGNIPWIKIGNIKSKYVNEYDELITEQGLNNSSAKLLKKGTILYTIFATLGEVGILDIEACTNQAIAGINITNPRITTDYLYYYLKSKKDYVNNIGRGVAQNNINLTTLKNFEIPLIDVDKQLNIVEILEKVERMICLKEKEIDDLDLLIKARFIEMFGDPVTDTKNWGQTLLKEHLESIKYGTSTPPIFTDDGYAFIRATNIKNGKIVTNDMKYIPQEEADRLEKCKLSGGEIIIVRSGVNAGDTCVVTDEYIGQYAGYDMILVLSSDLHPVFFNTLINTEYMDKVVKPLTRRAAQPHLNSEQTQRLPIIEVPFELQEQFADFVQQVDKSREEVKKSLEKTQQLYDSLMQEYFG